MAPSQTNGGLVMAPSGTPQQGAQFHPGMPKTRMSAYLVMEQGASETGGVIGVPVDPAEEIVLVHGSALQKFAMHPVYGSMTSHDVLARLEAECQRQGGLKVGNAWEGGPSQMKIMIDLGMFEARDFTRVKFTDLAREEYAVWTYCWADSPWGEMWAGVKIQDPNAHQYSYWFDIICLDQFNPLKMKTIERSNEIYETAKDYCVVGLACFGRVWCCAEFGCRDRDQIKLVSDFGQGSLGYLRRCKHAYMFAKKDDVPTFDSCRCSVPEDKDCVLARILQKFDSVRSFDLHIRSVAATILSTFESVMFQALTY